MLKILLKKLEVLLSFILYTGFSILPLNWRRQILGHLLKTIGPLFPVHKVGQTNITRSLPLLSLQEKEKYLKEAWQNLGFVAAEFASLSAFFNESAYKLEGKAHLDAVFNDSRGAIFFTGHLANWEICYAPLLKKDQKINILAKPVKNNFIQKKIVKMRSSQGISLIQTDARGTKKVLQALKDKQFIGALMDVHDVNGVTLPFFNQPARTNMGLARIAFHQNIPLLPMQVIRQEKGAPYIIRCHPALEPKTFGNPQELMQKVNTLYESWVRENPGQWLWFHKRWKLKKP